MQISRKPRCAQKGVRIPLARRLLLLEGLVVLLAETVPSGGARQAGVPIQCGCGHQLAARNPLAAKLPGELLELAAPGFEFAVCSQQATELARVGRFGLIIKAPVQPPGGNACRRLYQFPAPASLLIFRGKRVLPAVEARLASAIPAVLCHHHRLPGPGHFAHDALQYAKFLVSSSSLRDP